MIFEIHPDCFSDPGTTMHLQTISSIVNEGRHRIIVIDEEAHDYQIWLERQSIEVREFWDLALRSSVKNEALRPAKHQVKVTLTPLVFGENEINPSDARKLARFPFKIYVENNNSDRNFLLTYSTKDQLDHLKRMESAGQLEFLHCGGIGEIPHQIRHQLANNPYLKMSAAAVFDSDAKAPKMYSADSQRALDACEESQIPAFRLKRRAIENYLHRKWLNTWLNQEKGRRAAKLRLYNAFCNLNDEQRAHFHMKKGLSPDMEAIEKKSLTLYDDVPEEEKRVLMDGFGDRLSQLFAEDWIQNSEPSEDVPAWDEVNSIVSEILVLAR